MRHSSSLDDRSTTLPQRGRGRADYPRMRRLSKLRDRLRSLTLTPDAERGFDDARRRLPERPPRDERRIELALGLAFLAAASVLAVGGGGDVPAAMALALVVSLASLSRVEVAIGSGFAVPTELAVVPMLFLLPPAAVPVLVAAGLVLGRAVDAVTGRRHLERL